MSLKTAMDASSEAVKHLAPGLGTTAVTAVKGIGLGGAIGAFDFVTGVSSQVKNGNGLGTAVFKSGVESVLWATNPVLMGAATFAPAAVQGAQLLKQYRRGKAEERFDRRHNSYGRIGGNYMDTMQAQTMRQAAVQQIQGNKLNARSALGGEARIFSNTIY